MDNCDSALDWKTVFKKILGGSEKSSSSSLISNEEANTKILNGPEKSSSSSLISNEEANTNVNTQCKEKDLHENVTYISSSKISSASCNNISEDNANQSPYFHELTLGKRSTSELFLEREQDMRNNTKLSHNFSYNGKSNQVPEWNKAFKNISGKNSSTAMGNRNLISDPIKEQKNLQKCDASVELPYRRSTSRKNIYKEQKNLQNNDTSVNTRSTPRENVYKIPKSKDPEEEEVKIVFALSRMFKLDYHNLNDFDGAGVDIFKCDKNSFSKSSKVYLTDKSLKYESDSELSVPVKGLVAKYIPYTTTELMASPKVPFIEPPWDDDLLM